MTAIDLGPIRTELDRAAEAGRTVAVWWRDDDAVRDGPALDRLLRVSDRAGVPVALAAVPAAVEPSLARRVAREGGLSILVHGLRHADHARPGAKRSEFPSTRPLAELVRDAAEGLDRTLSAFGSRALPVLVPPWNRIAPALAGQLPGLGFAALSAFGDPGAGSARDVVRRIDTQLDPVDWRGTRSLRPVGQVAAHLRRALDGGATAVGLLTHHLVHDEALWAFTAAVADLVSRHPATRPTGLADLLANAGPSPIRRGPHATGAAAKPVPEMA